jgi:hypothetical protein
LCLPWNRSALKLWRGTEGVGRPTQVNKSSMQGTFITKG